MRLEIFKGDGVQPWRWRIEAGNNRSVGVSGEGFRSPRNAAVSAHSFLWGIQETPYVNTPTRGVRLHTANAAQFVKDALVELKKRRSK